MTSGLASAVLGAFLFVAPAAAAEELAIRAVRDLNTRAQGITSPGGVAWMPGSSRFIVSAPRADEVQLDLLDAFGDPVGTRTLAGVRVRSENVAFDVMRSRVVLFDDTANQLITVALGAGGSFDDAAMERHPAPALGPVRAAGIAIDAESGTLYVLDRLSRRIAVVPERLWNGADSGERAGWIELDAIDAGDLRGLGWNARTQRWYVVDAASATLIAVDGGGSEAGRWELDAGLTSPRGVTVAPTGDRTDDPTAMSVYIADAGSAKKPGRVVEYRFRPAMPLQTAATVSATLVRTINTFAWSPPSPDPSGIAYDIAQNRLLVADGEVEEMAIYSGANYFESSLTGTLLRTSNTRRFSDEPVGVAYDNAARVIISDDDTRTLYMINVGSDGHVGGSDDTWTSFDTRDFGNDDPEGVSYDKAGNRLFFSDGLGQEIFEQRAGSDGKLGTSDDVVSHFDTEVLNMYDPETVEYHPGTNTLFIVGKDHDKIIETTLAGALLNTITLSGIGLKSPAGMCLAPHSSIPGASSLYICDRANDNDSDPSENDGKIFEITASILGAYPGSGGGGGGGSTPGNSGGDFRVSTGSDDVEQSGSSVDLGSSDIELVTDGSTVQTVGLRFTGVTIPKNATVVNAWIQFTSDESQSGTIALTIEGQAADNPPTFTSSSGNVSARPRTAQSATWSPASWGSGDGAGSNQKTPSLTAIVQALVNRSGWASGNAMAFIITGIGRRTAVAYEGNASEAAVLHIEVVPPNTKPNVSAGSDRSVTLPASASLDGSVSDDGLPGPVTTQWTKVSGPGTVTFGNANAIDTQASFSVAGTYVLRLTANDGELSAFDEMQATVSAAPGGGGGGGGSGTAFPVKAGSDDAEQGGSSVTLSSDLELVTDGSTVQTVGLRFSGITVPKNATIANAWIQFTADESQSGSIALTIQGQAADNPATFTSSSSNISSRARTAASASWSPAAWGSSDGAGAAQKTPSLTAIVQELVNRSGWASGNAMAFIITGTGHRTAMAYEAGATKAPVLHIELGGGTPVNVKPTVSAGPNLSVTLPGQASLNGTVTDDGLPASGTLTTLWTATGPGPTVFVNPNEIDTQASFTIPGTYTLRLTASDGELSDYDETQVTVSLPGGGGGSTTFEKRIASGADDVEEAATGKVGVTSSDIELVFDVTNQTVGLRFLGVTIPKNATITNAWIQFTRDESGTEATSLTLAGHAIDSAPAFTTAIGNVSSRVKTGATVAWNPPSWNSGETAGPNQRTPGLESIVQELVNRSGWSSGNAVAFIVTGTGRRNAKAYEAAASSAALLHLEYTP